MCLARIGKMPYFVTFLNLPRICMCLTVTFNRPAYVVPLLSSATVPRTKSRYKHLWNTNNFEASWTCVASKESDTSKPCGLSTHTHRFACAVPSFLLPLWSCISPYSLSVSYCLTLSSLCVLFLWYFHTWPYRSQLPRFTRKTNPPPTDITSFLQHFTNTTAASACLSSWWRKPRHFPTLCVESCIKQLWA